MNKYIIEFSGYASLYAENEEEARNTLFNEDNEFIAADIKSVTQIEEDVEP